MSKITFTDKQALNENTNIPDINKVKDSDLNEIKEVINQTILNSLFGVYYDSWTSSGTFNIGDIVIYDAILYENLTGNNTATTPDQDSTNWQVVNIILNTKVNPKLIDKTDFIKNTNNNSQTDTYSCDYINNKITGTQLWTNPSLAGAFGPQTIPLDLSSYKYIELVYYRYPAATTPMFRVFTRVGDVSQLNYCDYDNSVRAWNREFEVKSTGIEFKIATVNGATNNNGLVPGKIIGHK